MVYIVNSANGCGWGGGGVHIIMYSCVFDTFFTIDPLGSTFTCYLLISIYNRSLPLQ